MNPEAWFFLLLILVIIPGVIGALFAHNHPEVVRRILQAVKAFLFSRTGAPGIYVRIYRDVRLLGWWALLPAVFALANCAWRFLNIWLAHRSSPHSNYLLWLSVDVGIGDSSLDWMALEKIFTAGLAMDNAILAPYASPAGAVFLWVLLAFLFFGLARRHDSTERRSPLLALSLCSSALFVYSLEISLRFWLTRLIAERTSWDQSGWFWLWILFSLLEQLVLIAVFYLLGTGVMAWRLNGRLWGGTAGLRRFMKILPAFIVLLFILNLHWILMDVAKALGARSFLFDFEGIGGVLYMVSSWIWSLLWIAFIPLAIAIAARGWSLRETWVNGRSLARRKAGVLLTAIPLFWGPFLILESAFWLLGFVPNYREPWTLFFSVGVGILRQVAFSMLSLFPIVYFYRVVGEDAAIDIPHGAAHGASEKAR